MSDVFTEPVKDNVAIATQNINNLGNLAHQFQDKSFELEDALNATKEKLSYANTVIDDQKKDLESYQLQLLAANETIAKLEKQLEALADLSGAKVAEFVQ